MTAPQDPTTPPGDGAGGPGPGYGPPGSDAPGSGTGGSGTGGGAAPGYPPPGGQPPSYGQPPAYGQQPSFGQAPSYGAPPSYGAAGGAASSPFGQPGGPQLAGWGERVGGALIDWFGPSLVAGVLYQLSTTLGSLAYVAALAWAIYNAYLQGQTGQSYGKKTVGLRLLREQDGQVLGGGLGIGRYFLHILDAIPCYVGLLWPLWDGKKQTFADKIVKSVVIKA